MTKMDDILRLVSRKRGATLDEVRELTGWKNPNSTVRIVTERAGMLFQRWRDDNGTVHYRAIPITKQQEHPMLRIGSNLQVAERLARRRQGVTNEELKKVLGVKHPEHTIRRAAQRLGRELVRTRYRDGTILYRIRPRSKRVPEGAKTTTIIH